MVEVTWTARARKDLDGISAYLAEGSPYYAQQTEWGIFQRAIQLEKQPRSGHPAKEIGDPTVRKIGYGRYRMIDWLSDPGHIAFVAVVHSGRNMTRSALRSRRKEK
ncbi:MAG: type II toxin-antitoxin system RelE/ParE family toxin [Flavobacteriales bacterium]|nr:type II toxin-antitoxin system RelE/ParE family toxin [Flavobacteriales bacterium]MBP9079439.1 type II toxin-antitoxin system RelE/ParE family toxin [Flavobacteriales bacterium]